MSERFARLKKYHGKPTKFMLKNDDGTEEEWSIYPLPARYLDLTTESQSIISDAPVKTDDDGKEMFDKDKQPIRDMAKLPEKDLKRFQELNKEILITSIAFSECIREGVLTYKDFEGGVPDKIIEEAKEAVGYMSQNYLGQIMIAVAKANNLDLTGEEKNKEVSH
jgi:hypothetical protein